MTLSENNSQYCDDDMLMLSGIQHFVFCPRQWALIDIEQSWEDNYYSTQGTLLHKNVDNPEYRAKNNDSIMLRHVSLVSRTLGLYGFSDVVELVPTSDEKNSISCKKYSGRFLPVPVEYKRGKPKQDLCDIMQLVCQVICLEQMHSIRLDKAALFYWETRHRYEIEVSDELRAHAYALSKQMHEIAKKGVLPKALRSPKCRNCSLVNICMPEINDKTDVKEYLKHNLYA